MPSIACVAPSQVSSVDRIVARLRDHPMPKDNGPSKNTALIGMNPLAISDIGRRYGSRKIQYLADFIEG